MTAQPKRMKILFVMRHAAYVRTWEAVLRLLAERGHRIHLGYELYRPQAEIADRLVAEFPNVTHGYVPIRAGFWRPLSHSLRQSVDYLRYLTPEYARADKLRARATRGTPRVVVRLMELGWLRSEGGRQGVDRLLRWLECVVPPVPEIDEAVRAYGSDIVMATPLVAGHSQHDYMRSARRLGAMRVLPVNSWDNLTNKGVLRDPPDRVFVWNEEQRREAVEFHGVPFERVAVVGAHSFDHWFRWQPSTTREEFCARVGLDPARPYLLYVCSSGFIAADERPYVRRWIEGLRSSGSATLESVGVLVRPHPAPGRVWEDNPLEGEPNVSVWPPIGAEPRNDAARADYFDSIHHAAVVVGVNTSAFIEAAIIGKRTYTILFPELRESQEGTLHFHYLRRENGGPVVVSSTIAEHLEQVAEAIERPQPPDWNERFLVSFVRPHGLHVESAPLLVKDLEEQSGAFAPRPVRSPSGAWRPLLVPLALLAMLVHPPVTFGIRRRLRAMTATDPVARKHRFWSGPRRHARMRRYNEIVRRLLPESIRSMLKRLLRGRVRFLPAETGGGKPRAAEQGRETG